MLDCNRGRGISCTVRLGGPGSLGFKKGPQNLSVTVFPSGQVDFQGEIWTENFLSRASGEKIFLALSRGGSEGMLPRKGLKILLLRLARIAFVAASFPPIFFS